MGVADDWPRVSAPFEGSQRQGNHCEHHENRFHELRI